MRTDGGAVAEHGAVDHRLPVDGLRQRPAHADVVQGRLGVVDGEDRLALGRADHDLESGVGLELRHGLGCREVREGVDIAGQHGGGGGCRIGDELEGGARQRRRLAPIVLVAHELDPVALDPAGEAEGAGADGLGLVGLGRRRLDDHHVAPAEIEEEMAGRPLQGDDDGRIVGGLDRGDRLEELLLRVDAVLGHRPLEAEDDMLGAERHAIVEGDARRQLEGVDEPVIRDRPGRGQGRLHGAALVDAGEAFEDVGVADLADGRRGTGGRVEMRRLEDHAELERILCRDSPAGEAGNDGERGDQRTWRWHRAFPPLALVQDISTAAAPRQVAAAVMWAAQAQLANQTTATASAQG